MTHFLEFQFSDGTYHIPITVIAKDRAEYYANVDFADEIGSSTWEEDFNKEYNYTMSHNDEIYDWLRNNMNWEDLEKYAVKYSNRVVNHEQEWRRISSEGEVRIVNLD